MSTTDTLPPLSHPAFVVVSAVRPPRHRRHAPCTATTSLSPNRPSRVLLLRPQSQNARRLRSHRHIAMISTSTSEPPSEGRGPQPMRVSQPIPVSRPIALQPTTSSFSKLMRICCIHILRSVFAAVLSAIALFSPMSAAATRAAPSVLSDPATGVVVFDKDFAASWEGGNTLSFRMPPQPSDSESPPNMGPDSSTLQPLPPSASPFSSPSGPPALPPDLGPRYVKGRGTGLPTPSLALEAQVLSRLLVALVVGGVIGMERRAANSLAGVRTFSLVSLGAAVFMSTTLIAFPAADPNRIAAAISSSVGFLGAGAMHKNAKHSRGLTTATSVWLAAALGIAAAAGLFLLSFSGAVATVLIARYARFNSSLHLIRGDPASGMTAMPTADELHDDQDEINEIRASKGQVQQAARLQANQAAANAADAVGKKRHGRNGTSVPDGSGQEQRKWPYRRRLSDSGTDFDRELD